MGVKVGESFKSDVGIGEITLRASMLRYKLADLIARCQPHGTGAGGYGGVGGHAFSSPTTLHRFIC